MAVWGAVVIGNIDYLIRPYFFELIGMYREEYLSAA